VTRGNRRGLHQALYALLVFAAPLLAQVTGPEAPNPSYQPDLKDPGGIRMDVEMALVNVTVTDPLAALSPDWIRKTLKFTKTAWNKKSPPFRARMFPSLLA
jgi:hypothetical protein